MKSIKSKAPMRRLLLQAVKGRGAGPPKGRGECPGGNAGPIQQQLSLHEYAVVVSIWIREGQLRLARF